MAREGCRRRRVIGSNRRGARALVTEPARPASRRSAVHAARVGLLAVFFAWGVIFLLDLYSGGRYTLDINNGNRRTEARNQ